MERLQDIIKLEKESMFQTNNSALSPARDKVLTKCKETLEKMQFELDEERQLSQNLKEKNDDFMKQLHHKDSDLHEAYKQFDIINSEYQKELDKVNNLQRENSLFKETNAKLHIYENKFNILRDKFTQTTAANTDLYTQIKKLEDGLKKRDELIEFWNESINEIEYKLTKSEDEKKEITAEKQMTKDMVQELTKIVKEKHECAKLLSPASTITNSRRFMDRDDCPNKNSQLFVKLNYLKKTLIDIFDIFDEKKFEMNQKV